MTTAERKKPRKRARKGFSLQLSNELTALVDADFIKANCERLVWLDDSWLSMRAITDDSKLLKFANHVAKVKADARAAGYVFPC
jgi:hypothetical protein